VTVDETLVEVADGVMLKGEIIEIPGIVVGPDPAPIEVSSSVDDITCSWTLA
jgi:hypothetical protein